MSCLLGTHFAIACPVTAESVTVVRDMEVVVRPMQPAERVQQHRRQEDRHGFVVIGQAVVVPCRDDAASQVNTNENVRNGVEAKRDGEWMDWVGVGVGRC
jgi:hypothetical protein